MKVNEAALQQILQNYSPKRSGAGRAKPAGDSSAPHGDEITISTEGQELQRMIRAAQQADDVRAQKVDDIRTQLRTGQYLLNPQEIANRMLGISGGGQ